MILQQYRNGFKDEFRKRRVVDVKSKRIVQRHGAKVTQKIKSRGRSLFSRPFACICIYNVISVVHQKIGLLIKLFVV